MKLFATIWMCLLGALTMAQQPAYFVFGEDQFRGIQVYDVIQDKQLNYWFATSEGIFLYDHIDFERVDCEKAKGNSVYNFISDGNGTIYCHNLNNQVFRIKDKRCEVFYELSEEEGGADVSLSMANDGNLLVASRWFIAITPAGKVVQRKVFLNNYIGPPFTLPNKQVVYHLNNSDSMVVYSYGKFNCFRLNAPKEIAQTIQILKFLKLNDRYFALDLRTKDVFALDVTNFTMKKLPHDASFHRSESVRTYETRTGIWIAGTLPGVIMKKSFQQNGEKIFYSDYFVSDVFEDVEGNILISTFDKGVIVVPDLQVPDVIYSFKDDPVTTLYSNGKDGLLLGTSKGKLEKFQNGKLSIVNDEGKRPIEVIGGHLNGDWNIVDNGKIRAINKKNGKVVELTYASLKDIVCVSKTVCFLGTNRGLVKVAHLSGDQFTVDVIKKIDQRIYFMEYDPKHSTLYLSTANGMIVWDKQGAIKELRYKGEQLYPNDCEMYKDELYICSKENGLLVYKNGHFVRQLNPVVNGQPLNFKKILFFKGSIIAQATNGFYQLDMKGNLLQSLHTVYGLSSKRVIDFTLHQGQLWVSHTGGVQKIDLYHGSNQKTSPVVRIDRIFVNGIETTQNRVHQYGSNERTIQFYFSSPSLRSRENVRYHYRLLGIDTTWSVSENGSHQVRYNALPSGDYVFEVKTEVQGVFSSVESFSFSIALPLYLRWWFLLIALGAFLGLVFFVYRRQLAIQQRKSEQINELYASKLTAIQSQMNPHFIFNSLNSIQDLILKGDVEHSYSYITTFSDLVRRTLNYSEKDFIDFEQEIKLLELYLSLEKLRFKKDFDYEIISHDVEDLMLPPLLVQPFIENALVHGLLHKEGRKHLKVEFSYENDLLRCIIEDNGIGREAARKIRQRQRGDHESFSSEAIRRRFEILSQVFEGEFGYEYIDLCDDTGNTGTRVVMSIPVRPKF